MHLQLVRFFFFPSTHYGFCALLEWHWGSSTGTQHYAFIYLLIFLCPCASVSNFPITKPFWTELFADCHSRVVLFVDLFFFCPVLLKAAVTAKSPSHMQKGSLTCLFGAVRCGSAAAVTDLCSRHSGRPPWAAGRWQISDGWQIRSTTLLICAAGLLRLTVFCVSVTELNWALIGDSVVQGSVFSCTRSFLDRCCVPLYSLILFFFFFFFAGDENRLCSSSH